MVDTKINLQNETIQTLITVGEEKSIFERAIIEAFKQKDSKAIYEKLTIALDEIKFMVNDIKTNALHKTKFLINLNTLDKLSRIIERKYFNVNILIAKIYESLLDAANFPILSDEKTLLIKFSNEVLNLLEGIDSTIVSKSLQKKLSSFLNYLINLEGLDVEQTSTISELINNFPTRNCSDVYKNFDSIAEKILKLCKNTNVDDKTEGITNLMENFGNTASLEEQFDLLMEKVPNIIKAVIHQPNPEHKDAYFQLGNFICSMLYATRFKLDAFMPEYRLNSDDLNKNTFFFLLADELIDETLKENAGFLHNVLYELTSQKEMLTKCENIYNICNLIINTISIYENFFDIQFVCYIILKRIYFTFPQFRKNIEDTLAMNLINICSFKNEYETENSEECRQFIYFLMKNGQEELRNKLKKRIENKNLNFDLNSYTEEDIAEVENENLKLSDFNLRIGYPNKYDIEAGCEMSKYIEVHHPNSLVYIGFATQYNDINLHLMKYIPNDDNKVGSLRQKEQTLPEFIDENSDEENTNYSDEDFTDKGHFKLILKLERIDASLSPVKIVMFVTEPGTYKLVFDNSFSWFNSKLLRFRVSVLKPISEIDFNRKVDFDSLRKKMKSEVKRLSKQKGGAKEIELANVSGGNVPSLLKNSPHANKILMAKIEGVNRAFKIDQIFNKQELISLDNQYLSIPVILTSKLIRIVRPYSDEYGANMDEYIDYPITSDMSYEKLFTDKLTEYIESISNFKDKHLFLNIFLVEKQLILTGEHDATIPIMNSNDKYYKHVLDKLTFYPQELLNKFRNLKFCLNSISDSCLLYSLYEKLLNDEKFNNIIHIHFDKVKPQVSLFFEGIFHDKISGFAYDTSLSLVDNVGNVIDFVNKVSVIFGDFKLSVSCSDIDQKVFELFANELKKNLDVIDSPELKISLEKKDEKFVRAVINLIHLFDIE